MLRTLLAAVAAVFVISCAGEVVRYSPYELQGFPPNVQEHIRNGEVSLGMSPLAVRYSWGAPKVVNVREAEDGSYVEEWIYTKMRVIVDRLIFTEGKLTGMIRGSSKRKPLMDLRKDDAKENARQDTGR